MDDTVALKVRIRRTLDASGVTSYAGSVYCASQARQVELATCLGCERCNALVSTGIGNDAQVYCHDPESARSEVVGLPVRVHPRHDLPRESLPAHTPISAVMSSVVACVRSDVSIDALTSLLLERGIGGVPVVDGSGAPVGVVSKTDLVRAGSAQGTVADIMTDMTFSLPVSANLSQAAALMAYEGVHRVPVTCTAGKVVGIVSALDILRWMARQDGYIVAD